MKHQHLRSRWLLAGLAVGAAALAFLPATTESAEIVEFNRDIRPIFIAHCTACLGGVQQTADLSFAYPEQVLPPEGWVVQPGDPDGSELLIRVISKDADTRMPPPEHGPALSDREVGLLRDWIAQGAKWHRHWAFGIPRKPPLPEITLPEIGLA